MTGLATFFLVWFLISIPFTFFIGAILGLSKKNKPPKPEPAPQQQKQFGEAPQEAF